MPKAEAIFPSTPAPLLSLSVNHIISGIKWGNHQPLTVLLPHIQLNPRHSDSCICRLYPSWIKQGLHCSELRLHRNTFSLSDESDRSLTHKKCTKSGMQFKEFISPPRKDISRRGPCPETRWVLGPFATMPASGQMPPWATKYEETIWN